MAALLVLLAPAALELLEPAAPLEALFVGEDPEEVGLDVAPLAELLADEAVPEEAGAVLDALPEADEAETGGYIVSTEPTWEGMRGEHRGGGEGRWREAW